MTIAYPPLSTVVDVAALLVDWLARDNAGPTEISASGVTIPWITLHADGSALPALAHLGMRHRTYFQANGIVCEELTRSFKTVAGAWWMIEAIVRLGPVSEYGDLLPEHLRPAASSRETVVSALEQLQAVAVEEPPSERVGVV